MNKIKGNTVNSAPRQACLAYSIKKFASDDKVKQNKYLKKKISFLRFGKNAAFSSATKHKTSRKFGRKLTNTRFLKSTANKCL